MGGTPSGGTSGTRSSTQVSQEQATQAFSQLQDFARERWGPGYKTHLSQMIQSSSIDQYLSDNPATVPTGARRGGDN